MTEPSSMPSSASAVSPQVPVKRRTAWELALLYAGLIVYASLYPFAPWRSNGLPWWGFLTYPWPRYWTKFDIIANLLGYLPLGFLLVMACLRSQGRILRRLSVLLAFVACLLLSFSVESLQNWLPRRVPSNVDLLLNTMGGMLGAILAWIMGKAGALDAWSRLRKSWFVHDAQEGLVLLLLWPWALLYPLPVPFGLGQVQERLEDWLGQWLAGTPFVEWLPVRTIEFQPMLQWQISLVVALGAALPCLLAFGAMKSWRRRIVLAVVLLGVGVLASALGNALGLGPNYAWSWLWPPVKKGLLGAVLLVVLAAPLPRWLCKLSAISALLVQLYFINGAAVPVYFGLELELEGWLPGEFIRFYGLTQWLGWLWPYAVLLYLVLRLYGLVRRSWAARYR